MKTSVLLHPDFFDWELDKQPLCVEMNEQKALCSLKNTGPSQCLTPTVPVYPTEVLHCFYKNYWSLSLLQCSLAGCIIVFIKCSMELFYFPENQSNHLIPDTVVTL